MEELYEVLQNASNNEIIEILDGIAEAGGYECSFDMLKQAKKSLKEEIENIEFLKDGWTKSLEELSDKEDVLEIKNDLEEIIYGMCYLILSVSAEFGNVRWLRKNNYVKIFKLEESYMSIGMTVYESRKIWATIFNALSDRFDFISINAEKIMNVINQSIKEYMSDYEDLIEDDSFENLQEVLEEIDDIIDAIIKFYKIYHQNFKELKKIVKVYS